MMRSTNLCGSGSFTKASRQFSLLTDEETIIAGADSLRHDGRMIYLEVQAWP